MDECLRYFREAIERPGSVPPWAEWWQAHADVIRREFTRPEYLRLKFRKLPAAREILERRGLIAPARRVHPIDRTHCEVCGEPLFKLMPDSATAEEVAAFAKRTIREDWRLDPWLHYGVYCPNGCTEVMLNFRRVRDEDEPR